MLKYLRLKQFVLYFYAMDIPIKLANFFKNKKPPKLTHNSKIFHLWQNRFMIPSDFYQPCFIKDLKIVGKHNRVSITGVITTYKIKEKLILFTVDDNTSTVLCLYFKTPGDKTKFLVGSLISIKGEYELNRFLNEEEYQIKVHKYSFLKDVNEELYCYLETYLQTKIKANENIKMEVEPPVRKEFLKPPPKSPKRIPLSTESLSVKLRTLIFRCLREQIEKISKQDEEDFHNTIDHSRCYVTFLDLIGYKPMSDFIEKENVSGKYDISKAISDMEKLMLINAIPQHSQEDYEGTKYEINYNRIINLKDDILNCIKEAGSTGIRIEELFKEVNSLYSPQIFVLSREYIWQVADELFNEDKIFLSKNNVFHYLDKLYAG